MVSKLVMCSACGVAIRPEEAACPHCGVARRVVSAPIASGAILLGLMLAGCPAGDDGTESMGGTSSASSTSATTDAQTSSSTMSGGASQSSTSVSTSDSTTTDDPSGSVSAQPPYGVPDTTSGGPVDTETDTEGDTTTGGVKLDLPADAG